MAGWLNATGEAIIRWGTRTKWYTPTVMEVIEMIAVNFSGIG